MIPNSQENHKVKVPRWYLAYFLLAAFNIITVVAGFWLITILAETFEDSVALNKVWSVRTEQLSQFRTLAGKVNAPGNDVFDSHDAANENLRLQTALAQYSAKKAEIKQDITLNVDAVLAKKLLMDISVIQASMDVMTGEANNIFSLFQANKPALAGQRMATMDRQFASVSQAFSAMETDIRKTQQAIFSAQLSEVNSIHQIEIYLTALIIIMVCGATLYGRTLYRTMKTDATERLKLIVNLNKAKNIAEHSSKELIAQKAAMDEHSLVSITDIKGNITYANEKFCTVSGYSLDELIGKNHRLLNSKHQPQDYWREMYLTCSKGGVFHDEVRNQAKNGHYYWVDTTIVPLFNAKNKLEGYTSIRTDTSLSKENAEQLDNAKIEAETATIAKSQFLATMSHEIRTPMNGVIGMAQLLDDTPLNNEQQEYLNTITTSGNNLLSIINDILDFSKLDANKVELESIAFDFEQLTQECLELVSGNCTNNDLEFILDYHPNCPRFYMGDPSRIRQVLLNLLGNAVKFTAKGFVRCGVACVITESGENQLRLEIQDTGIGLKPEALTHLFDEFTQADSTTTRQFGGTGLGLAITKKLIEIMDGELGVDSIYGEGSTFWIQGSLTPAEAPLPLKTATLDGVKILLVDDNKESRRVFTRMFEHMGADATVLSDATQVVGVLHQAQQQNTPFKLAVLDHNMPEKSGLELGLDIRRDAQFNDLKLLIFSSAGAKGDAASFAQAGFDAYLNKLIRYETLKGILSAMLEHNRANPIITQHSINDAKRLNAASSLKFNASILLVEDILPNQIIAKKFLSNLGVNVDVANDGQDALNAYTKNKYDLIFMDCRMPVMDGYEATGLIRQLEKDHLQTPMPIIALTANASSDDRILCEQAGMDDVVTKPYKRDELAACLQHWLPHLALEQERGETKSTTSANALQSFDDKIYQQLHEDMGEDIQTMLDAVYQSLESNLSHLKDSHKDASTDDMIRWAHSLKSPAANLGALQLSKLAGDFEHALRHAQVNNKAELITELHNEYQKVKQCINET